MPQSLQSEWSSPPGEPQIDLFADALNAALVANRPTAVVGLVMGITVLGLTFAIFQASAPRFYLIAWGILCGGLMIGWVVAASAIPTDLGRRSVVLFWVRVTTILITVGDSSAVLSIWLFFPSSDYHHRLYVAALHAALIPSQIVCCPGHIGVNRTATVGLLGSLILMFALIDGASAWPMIAFLISLLGMMLAISGFVRDRMRDAVLLRLAGEEVSRTLETALASVIAARDAKARFIAAASHDLGQPLQAAALFFDQAMRAKRGLDRCRAAEGVQRALATGEEMIARMLDHMRLDADAVQPITSLVELGPLLKRIEAQYAPAAALQGMSLNVVAIKLTLATDSSLLERALGNLIGNAIRHSQGSRVLIGVRKAHQSLRLWVIDNGRGVEQSDAAQIFDDYYRGVANSGDRGGFGLGLASARRITSLLDGSAGIDLSWKQGAAFYLEFPQSLVHVSHIDRDESASNGKATDALMPDL